MAGYQSFPLLSERLLASRQYCCKRPRKGDEDNRLRTPFSLVLTVVGDENVSGIPVPSAYPLLGSRGTKRIALLARPDVNRTAAILLV